MTILQLQTLSADQIAQISQLWDSEYPLSLQGKFISLLEKGSDWQHFVAQSASGVVGWAGIFTEAGDTRFSIIVAQNAQGKGLGRELIKQLRQVAGTLAGWVVDQTDALKADGSRYLSPLPFYQKLGFEVLPNQRFDTEELRSVRVQLGPRIFVTTERFWLREVLPSDEAGFWELDADPEVHRYLGNKPVTDRAQIREVIGFIRQQYVQHGIGRWAVVDKQSGEFVGWSGLKFVTDPHNGHQNFYDLGYRIQRKHWRQGIGKETATAALAYGFERLKLEEIFAAAACDNVGSNKILQSLGFRLGNTFFYDDLPCHWYGINKQQYFAIKNKEVPF